MTVALEGGEWSAARPSHTLPPRKDPVPILQEARWDPGPVWTGRKSHSHQDSIPDRPAHSQSLYCLSYPAHKTNKMDYKTHFISGANSYMFQHQGGIISECINNKVV